MTDHANHNHPAIDTDALDALTATPFWLRTVAQNRRVNALMAQLADAGCPLVTDHGNGLITIDIDKD